MNINSLESPMEVVPRIYSPTPLLLWPRHAKSGQVLALPFVTAPGVGTPIFDKGRSCLSFIFSVLKKQFPKKNKILIPAYGARSIVFAAIHAGLEPRIVDVDVSTFFFNFEKFKNAIDDTVLTAVLPYNWGVLPELEQIKNFHKLLLERDIPWIDDFATTVIDDEFANYFNHGSPCLFFSFGKTKVLTIMDGGYALAPKAHTFFKYFETDFLRAKCSQSDEVEIVESVLRLITNFGYKFYVSRFGYGLLSCLGVTAKERPPKSIDVTGQILSRGWETLLANIVRKHYHDDTSRRCQIAMIYRELISESKECENVIQQIGYQTGSRFPILCSDKKTRDFLYKKLNGNGIGASLGYICWMKKVKLLESFFKDLKDRDFSGAIELEDRLLTLPLHSKMTRLDVVRIVDLLNTKL